MSIDYIKNNVEGILNTTSASVYWKDRKGIYLGANDVFANAVQHTLTDVIGKNDRDFIWHEQAPIFERNDQETIHSEKSLTIMEPAMCFNENRVKFYLSHKTPLKAKNGKIIGIFGLTFSLDHLQSTLPLPTESHIFTQQSDKVNLTKRQEDCLFYLLKGMTMKQIANTLSLSPKTIEHYLDRVKEKLGCFNRTELIAKASQMPIFKKALANHQQ